MLRYSRNLVYRFLEYIWIGIISVVIFKATLNLSAIAYYGHFGYFTFEISKALTVFTGVISSLSLGWFGLVFPFLKTNEDFRNNESPSEMTAYHLIAFLTLFAFCWSANFLNDTNMIRRMTIITISIASKTVLLTAFYFTFRRWFWK